MADGITIVTNNVPRNLVYGYELSAKERKDFDYIAEEDFDCHDFFRYKGQVYDPSEFMRADGTFCPLKAWHGYSSDTFFSGIVIRFVNDNEQVIVGTYYS